MTILTPITTGCTNEARRESTWPKGFGKFLPIFANYVEAARDLEGIDFSYDPACSMWRRDEEVAHKHLLHSLANLRHLPVRLPEDRPLQRFTLLIDAMLDDANPASPRDLHRQMQIGFFLQFQVLGFGPAAQHRNAMLIHARHLADAMARLSLFDFSPENEIGDVDLPDSDETPPGGS